MLRLLAISLGVSLTTSMAAAFPSVETTQGTSRDTELRITDDAGREIELDKPATRVAALAPFAADLLAALGVDPIAAPTLPDGSLPWQGCQPLKVTHGGGPSLEQLVAARPDLIVSTSVYAHTHDAIERALGVPVLTLDIDSIHRLPEHARTLARLTGQPEAGASLAASFTAMLEQFAPEQAQDELASEMEQEFAEPVRVLAIFGGARMFYGFLPESYLGSVLSELGHELTTAGLESHTMYAEMTPLSLEHVLKADPDVVLVLGHGSSAQTAETIRNDRAWRSVRAVREGRVHALPDELFVLRPGTDVPGAIVAVRDAVAAE